MNKVKEWVLSQQDACDKIIAQACHAFWAKNAKRPNFHYDLKKCHEESYELVKGRDLCYDRLNTAFSYALWYHPRRINTFLSFFIDKLVELHGQTVEVFDLGAGTGAVQWAVLLVARGLKAAGMTPPKIRMINIDTSPLMLYFNKGYLWKHFNAHYQFTNKEVNIEYEVNSWNNQQQVDSNSHTVFASSYLFDSSDNQEKIKEDFIRLVDQYQPSNLLLLTSQKKQTHLHALGNYFKKNGYAFEKNLAITNLLFSQSLAHINALRKKLVKAYNDITPLSRNATWTDTSYGAIILSKKQKEMAFSIPQINEINLFNPPITVRTEVVLNEKQKKAAEFSDKPSVIIGPAGCGKSIVITEKIVNTVRQHNYDPSLKILVTTFNKLLIKQLSLWLKDMLDETKIKVGKDGLWFLGSHHTNITIMHFDILPGRLGKVKFNGLVNEAQHLEILQDIIDQVKSEQGITKSQHRNILEPDFLLEEYNRVIYGLEVGIKNGKEKYYSITRYGRGNNPGLPKNGLRRQLVFSILAKYAQYIYKHNIPSFTVRRQLFKHKLMKEQVSQKFDYIFVDEFQDCTLADFKIFNLLLKNPDHLCISGDLAQAVHIGKSANIPRFNDMARRGFHRLEGSYRLPVRISEAIKPISEVIKIGFNHREGANIITPYKGSPPGARPIVVYASNLNGMATKISHIFNIYRTYGLEEITILEKDYELTNALKKLGLTAENDTILRLKGLEKRCIIWSTRIDIEYEKEVFEFVYTILSRTSAILIIALSDNTLPVYKPVIGKFKVNRLIFWDEETEQQYSKFCEAYEVTPHEDE